MLAFASIAATCHAWTSSPSQRKGATIRIPINVIRIAIDDSEKLFQLSNLDQRFTADALTRFIDRFVRGLPKEGELPCVLIESSTKRTESLFAVTKRQRALGFSEALVCKVTTGLTVSFRD